MKRKIPILILIILSHTSFGQIPNWTDLKVFGGYSFDNSTSITVDKNNNYYLSCNISNAQIVGTDSLQIDCDSYPYSNPDKNTNDAFLLRFDSSKKLNLVLKSSLGLSGVSGVDSAGNIYVSGAYNFGASRDGYVIKYSSEGKEIWTKLVQSLSSTREADDVITSMDVSDDGTIAICGFSYGSQVSIFGNGMAGPANFIAKITSDGNVIWKMRFSSTLGIGAYRVKFDHKKNVIVAGNRTNGNDYFAVVAKINGLDGTIIWEKHFPGISNYTPIIRGIGILSDSYAFGGSYGGEIDIDGNVLTSAGNADIFLFLCDTLGNVKWVRTGGSQERDIINYVTTDEEQNILFTGGYSDNFLLNGVNYLSKGNLDVYVGSFDKSGNLLWMKTGGSKIPGHTDDFFYNEFGSGIAIDSKGQIEVIGTTIGSGKFGTLSYNFSEEKRQNVFWLTLGKKESNYTLNDPCGIFPNKDTMLNISIFPNPFFDKLIISNSGEVNLNYDLSLYNSLGQRVKKIRYSNSSTITINDWSALPKGTYFLNIKTQELSRTFKLLKQ